MSPPTGSNNQHTIASPKHPPAVTFFLCLLSLAVSFICLSSYSYTHTLPNPDLEEDWHDLLSSLSQLHLCTKANANASELVSSVPYPLMERGKDRETLDNSTKDSSVTHLNLKVPLAVTASPASGSVKDLCLNTTLRASQLNLGGNEIVNVTLEFLSGNGTHTCVTISAPTHILPKNLLSLHCPACEKNISPVCVEATDQPPTASQTCYSLHSKNDPPPTVMLTQEEQSVAARHLLEVSVCLLGVCLILCLTASFTHSLIRRDHWNGLDLQNEPLMDT